MVGTTVFFMTVNFSSWLRSSNGLVGGGAGVSAPPPGASPPGGAASAGGCEPPQAVKKYSDPAMTKLVRRISAAPLALACGAKPKAHRRACQDAKRPG